LGKTNKPIYEPKTKAREYGDLALNIYTGCNHGCVYCYAPMVLKKSREQFQEVQPRKGIIEAVKRQLKREAISGKTIHLCFTCDPYPAEVDTTPTREIIEAIKNSGNHVQILTKGGFRAERDFDLLDSGDKFGVTIAGDKDFIKQNEPNAAHYLERILTLGRAKKRGIKTWVSCEPVYNSELVFRLIETGSYIDLFKIGKLNYHPSPIDWAAFGAECERLCKYHGRNYYLKADLRAFMEGRA
jgi:DNA repair photolyase